MEFNQLNQNNGSNRMRNDIKNLENAIDNDNIDEIIHKNFGLFSKKSVVKMFMKRRNDL